MKLHLVEGDEAYDTAFEYVRDEDLEGVLGVHYRDGGLYDPESAAFAGIELRHPDQRHGDPVELEAGSVEAVDYNDLTGVGVLANKFFENTDGVLTYFNNFDSHAEEVRGSEEAEQRLFQFIHTLEGAAERNGELVLQVDESSEFYDTQFYHTILTLVDEEEPLLEGSFE
ncbi:hypothetical protein [Candidatus Nanohalovita haloferacivicina]|uniref:hypothetical protein n=1 Tax=Candidatus Nanohalovita haloferacivicina TaxID=2978046 RepID=UPI00325FD398|nr:hypothetical protein HBNXNv_0842 [Candidatus Nanohalobia archaeon BNXNv]